MTNSIIEMEGARILFCNFSGKEGKFNKEGDRNFCVLIDIQKAEELEKDGWNIKWLNPKDDQEDRQAYLQVAVSFKNFPPEITLITSSGKKKLDEESVSILDWADIISTDLRIRPYNWDVNGKTGVKAYLKDMYVLLREDKFEKKYKDIDEESAIHCLAVGLDRQETYFADIQNDGD